MIIFWRIVGIIFLVPISLLSGFLAWKLLEYLALVHYMGYTDWTNNPGMFMSSAIMDALIGWAILAICNEYKKENTKIGFGDDNPFDEYEITKDDEYFDDDENV